VAPAASQGMNRLRIGYWPVVSEDEAKRKWPTPGTGFLRCCLDTIRANIGRAAAGDHLQCPHCLGMMEMTPSGRWHWLEDTTLAAPAA